MKNKNKQGISLIVLVLTIIIMIILAAAVIVTLSNSNIIDRADEAVTKTDVAQLQQLASIAWAEAYAKSVEDGKTLSQVDLEEAVNNYLIDNGYSEATLNNYDISVDLEGVTVVKKDMEAIRAQAKFDQEFLVWQANYLAENNNVIPQTFQYGDYEYYYNKEWTYGKGDRESWSEVSDLNGWGVRLIADRKQKEYGLILTSAFGEPIKSLSCLYGRCKALEKVNIIIPDTVTRMKSMFYQCTSSINLPDNFKIPEGVIEVTQMFASSYIMNLPEGFKIPNSVTAVRYMFHDCTKLISLPEGFKIPDSVTDVTGMFGNCTSLTSLPSRFSLPNSVENVSEFLGWCTSLTSLPATFTLPASVTSTEKMLNHCTSLISLPATFALPNSVTSTGDMFWGCSNLTSLPEGFKIPNSVTKAFRMFGGCTNLTANLEINAYMTGANSSNYMFDGTTKPITLTTTASEVTREYLESIAATSTNGNVTVNSAIQ